MKDYLPFGDSFKRFVEAALIPAAVAVGIFAFLVYPSFPEGSLVDNIDSLSSSETLGLLGLATLTMSLAATVLRPLAQSLLEGHRFRRQLGWLQARNQRKLVRLEQELRRPDLAADDFVTFSRQKRDFPDRLDLVMPTRLGNRMRAAETYGLTRFGLDTPTFTYELRKHAGEQLVLDLDRNAGAIDAMISSVVCAWAFAVGTTIVLLAGGELHLLIHVLGAAVVAVASYYGSVAAAKGHLAGMRALVHEGRYPLAKSLGVRIPDRLENERELWTALVGFAYWGPGITEPWPRAEERRTLIESHRQQDQD